MSVVVVGSVNRDVVTRVARIPAPGETVLASGLTRTGGGKGANQAVAAARAGGAPTAFVGAVGADADGTALRDGLAADGVDVSGIRVVDAPTGTALISVADDGENAIVVVAGANAAIRSLDADQRALVTSAAVLVTQLEVPVELVLDAAAARGEHAWHVLNAAPSSPLTDPAVRDAVLATVDVLIVNEHELLDVAGVADADTAIAALSPSVHALVVTRGAEGCVVMVDGRRVEVPAFAARAVDTTGAGDTFCGVLAAALAGIPRAAGTIESLATAARTAAAAAAIAVTRPGAQDAVPTRTEVADLLDDAASR